MALEKELLYQHVARLADKQEKLSKDGKMPALELARQLNTAQSQLKARTRTAMVRFSIFFASILFCDKFFRLFLPIFHLSFTSRNISLFQARVAELSIVKSQLLESERERVRLAELVEESIVRFEKGLPPNEIAEKEWKRMEAKNLQRTSETQETEDQDLFPLAEGYTTAVPRPNAYIPKDGSLPLPRPYGALAPFKPTQPGSMMRHFRKPEPKPIDI